MMISLLKNPLILVFNWKRVIFWGIFCGIYSFFVIPPLNLYVLEFFMFLPFCYLYHPSNRDMSKKQVFVFGFLCGLFIMIVNFYWIIHTIMTFGNLPFFISTVLFLIYASYVAMKFALIFFIPFVLHRRFGLPVLISLLFSCFFIEILFPEIFPFYLGNAQLYHTYFSQIADIIGVGGISLLVILVNYLLYRYFSTLQKKYLLIIAIVFFSTYSYSFLRNVEIQSYTLKHKSVQLFSVGVVQPNVPFSSSTASDMETITQRLISQTDRLLQIHPSLDLIVWPESAIPYSLRMSSYGRKLSEYMKSLNVPLIYNAALAGQDGKEYSAAILQKPGSEESFYYNKNKLLPFGEYLPTDRFFPGLHKYFPEVGNFSRGTEKVVFPLSNSVILAPQICYEIILPYFTRHFIRKGANLIVNLTNDAWFGNTRASSLHLWAASFRAIENRVPIIRATNSGISTIIGIQGWSIMKKTELFTETQFVQTIPLYQKIHSLYSFLGNWPIGLLLAFLFGRSIFQVARKTKKTGISR